MGYIYKIINLVNGKVYIGQTVTSIQQRFTEHKSKSKNLKDISCPLHNAMRKYGIENFEVYQIEEVDNSILDDREKFWINHYDSYNIGYNATLGGEGAVKYNSQEIINLYNQYHNQSKVAEIAQCDRTTVSRILKGENINLSKRVHKNSRAVEMLKNNEVIQKFLTYADACRYLIEHNYTTNKNLSSISGKIKDCCEQTRISAYGFKWRYVS